MSQKDLEYHLMSGGVLYCRTNKTEYRLMQNTMEYCDEGTWKTSEAFNGDSIKHFEPTGWDILNKKITMRESQFNFVLNKIMKKNGSKTVTVEQLRHYLFH